MDGFFFLLGILAVAWVLATPILLILQVKLKNRVKELADQIKYLDTRISQSAPQAAPDEKVIAQAVQEPEAQTTQVMREPDAPEETVPSASEALSSMPAIERKPPEVPPKAYVFRQDKIAEVFGWLKENWVVAAGAVSLSLAGIFLVQYGVESGLLTPVWRVIAAIAFGLTLLAGGEFMRRRFGDETDGDTRFLPSALSGAGLMTLFAAVLSARVLYGLIGPGPAFAGLAAVSAIGVVFGWFYGPVLSVVGILGATLAPYLIGGSSEQVWILQYYFALIALTALGIDTFKRWAWVSVLGLLATGASIWLAFLGTQASLHFIAAVMIVGAGAILIPGRRLVPDHNGAPVLGLLWKKLPEFPTRLSFAATLNAGVAALAVSIIGGGLADAYLGLLAMVVLMLAATLWMWRAPALADHAIIPGLAFLGLIASQALLGGSMYQTFASAVARAPETAPPSTVWLLLGVAAFGTALMFWRMPRANMPLIWALAASSLAPIAVFLLEFLWDPSKVHGAYPWALAVIAVAGLMTILAERSMRLVSDDKALITSLFAVAAVSLIGMALFLMLTKTALTLALAIMILLVTLLDRRFDLPLLVLYAVVGCAVITYRLVIDPGLDWAMALRRPLLEVVLAFVGTMAILAGAWTVARGTRARLAATLESTIWVLGAAFVLVLFERLLPGRGLETHWGIGLLAAVWATMALAQIHRMQGAPKFERVLRWCLAIGLALITCGILALRFMFFSYLEGAKVIGVPFFSSLAVAYLPLAIVLGLAAWKLKGLHRYLRLALGVISVGYLVTYVGLSIRHFWRGSDLSVGGFTDPELYTYTIAMLLASAGILVVAFWKRAVWLRKLAMAGIALTIAKVFFVDMSGLAGLLRVVSFMGLGLALLALTWLDRVMSAQWEKGEAEE